jgi:hypothetical protein
VEAISIRLLVGAGAGRSDPSADAFASLLVDRLVMSSHGRVTTRIGGRLVLTATLHSAGALATHTVQSPENGEHQINIFSFILFF